MSIRLGIDPLIKRSLRVSRRQAILSCACSESLRDRVDALARQEARTRSTQVQVLLIEALAARARKSLRKGRGGGR